MAAVEKGAVGAADSGGEAGVSSPEKKKLKKDDGSDSDSDSDSDSKSIMFSKQKRESDGFDVDIQLPRNRMGSLFSAFNDLNKVKPSELKECDDFARKAVEYQNLHKNPEKANLEYVKLLKFNKEFIPVKGRTYYLTLEAKNVTNGSIDSYQAKVFGVFSRLNGAIEVIPEVLIFRKRDDTSLDVNLNGKSPCGCQGSWLCGC